MSDLWSRHLSCVLILPFRCCYCNMAHLSCSGTCHPQLIILVQTTTIQTNSNIQISNTLQIVFIFLPWPLSVGVVSHKWILTVLVRPCPWPTTDRHDNVFRASYSNVHIFLQPVHYNNRSQSHIQAHIILIQTAHFQAVIFQIKHVQDILNLKI